MSTSASFFICKQDGRIVPFRAERIVESITLAARESGVRDLSLALDIGQSISEEITREHKNKISTTSDIRQRVLELLKVTQRDDIVEAYSSYVKRVRAQRSKLRVVADKDSPFSFRALTPDKPRLGVWNRERFASELATFLNLVQERSEAITRFVDKVLLKSGLNTITVSFLIETLNIALSRFGLGHRRIIGSSASKIVNSANFVEEMYGDRFLKLIGGSSINVFGAVHPHTVPCIEISIDEVRQGSYSLTGRSCATVDSWRTTLFSSAGVCRELTASVCRYVELAGIEDLFEGSECSAQRFWRDTLLLFSTVLPSGDAARVSLVVQYDHDIVFPLLNQYLELDCTLLPNIIIRTSRETPLVELEKITGLATAFATAGCNIELRGQGYHLETPLDAFSVSVPSVFLASDGLEGIREQAETLIEACKLKSLRLRGLVAWERHLRGSWANELFTRIESNPNVAIELSGLCEYLAYCSQIPTARAGDSISLLSEILDKLRDVFSAACSRFAMNYYFTEDKYSLEHGSSYSSDMQRNPQLIPFVKHGGYSPYQLNRGKDETLEIAAVLSREAGATPEINIAYPLPKEQLGRILKNIIADRIGSVRLVRRS